MLLFYEGYCIDLFPKFHDYGEQGYSEIWFGQISVDEYRFSTGFGIPSGRTLSECIFNAMKVCAEITAEYGPVNFSADFEAEFGS